ncbi:hypothetical protein HG530_012238 [Fusarium avenaceum]|nr:hypothetical protein HG530_012238 [Fusarium avenaceum]
MSLALISPDALEATKLTRSSELRGRVGESALGLVSRLLLLILVIRVFLLLVIIGLLVLVVVVARLVITRLIVTRLIVTRLIIAGLVATIRAFSGSLSGLLGNLSLSRLFDNLRLSRSVRSSGGSGRSGRSSSRVTRVTRVTRSSASFGTRVTGANLLRLATVSDTLEGDALLGHIGDLDARDLGSVAHVGVDAHKHLSVAGGASRDLDVASRHRLAVTAAAVELAKVGNLEVLDDNGTTTVVLNDLVFGTGGTSAVDGGGLTVLLLLDRESIFANGVPDNIVQDNVLPRKTFSLLTDTDVGKSGALLEDEDSVRVTTFLLTSARNTAVEDSVTAIKRLASSNGHGSIENAAATGTASFLTGRQRGSSGGLRRSGSGIGTHGQSGRDKHTVLHLEFLVGKSI